MSYIGQGDRVALDFSQVGSAEAVGQRVEQKFCEECGRPFCRPAVQVQRGALERHCARCVELARLRRERESQEHAAAIVLGKPQRKAGRC